jgi:hypothetical protein
LLIPVFASAVDWVATPSPLSLQGKARSTIRWEQSFLVTRSLLRRFRMPMSNSPDLALAGRLQVRKSREVFEEHVLTK